MEAARLLSLDNIRLLYINFVEFLLWKTLQFIFGMPFKYDLFNSLLLIALALTALWGASAR
jgi:hypothetical protein